VPIIVGSSAPRTLGDLKTRIADELSRADLAAQIALAITDAIAEASTHRFWFMETRGLTLPLTGGTSHYVSDDIAAFSEIDRLVLLVGPQRRTLRPMRESEVDRLNDGTIATGEPYAYSRYGAQLTLYPQPRMSYTVLIDGLTRGTALDSDSDSNIWTTDGERYIRALAKRNLLIDVTHDDDAAKTQDALAERYRQEYWAQTHSRNTTGQMACYA
jgi:hypothetical protein